MSPQGLPTRFADGRQLANPVRIARGELFSVYRVELEGGSFALKVAHQTEGAGLLLAEARALVLASSPALPRLHDVGWWDEATGHFQPARGDRGRPGLLLEWLEEVDPGVQTEAERLRSAMVAARDLGGAISDLHRVGLAHGDLKSTNLVVTRDGFRLLDLGLTGPLHRREVIGGTPRYLPTSDADWGDAASRDLLAFGVTLREIHDPMLLALKAPIDHIRRSSSAPLLDGWVGPLVARLPSARPSAEWVSESAAAALAVGGERDQEDRSLLWRRSVRASYLRVRGDSIWQCSLSSLEVPWLEEIEGWSQRFARFSGDPAIRPELRRLTAGEIVLWLVSLVGPEAARWPLGQLFLESPRKLAEAFERLATSRPPRAWSLAEVELALRGEETRAESFPTEPISRAAELARALSESPPSLLAIEEVERDLGSPRILVTLAAAGLRLRGEFGRGVALGFRPGAEMPLSLLADLHRRAGDLAAAADVAGKDEGDPDCRAVLGRVALDSGRPSEARGWVANLTSARAAEVLALAESALGERALALAALDRGEAYAKTAEERARLFGARGFVLSADQPDEARLAYLAAADFAVRAGAIIEEASYLTGVAALSVDGGFVSEGVSVGERAALIWEGLNRPGRAAIARLSIAAGLATIGDVARTEAVSARVEPVARLEADHRATAYACLAVVDARHALASSSNPDMAETDPAVIASVCDRALAALGSLARPTPDERLHVLARALLSGKVSPADREAADELARGESASNGARLSWWGARAAIIDAGERADEVLIPILGLSTSRAPLEARGLAVSRAMTLATERGRSDLIEVFRGRARDIARLFVERVGAPLNERALELGWVRSLIGYGSQVVDSEQALDLERLVRSLDSGEQLSTLLRRVVDALVLWTGVERGLLLLKAPDGRLMPRAARNFAKDDLHGEQRELPQSLARRALEAREPIVAVDASGELASAHKSVHALKLRSVLVVPLLARGEGLGVVYLDDRVRKGAFGPRELAWVKTIATLASSMIAAARDQSLLRRAVRSRERANRKLEETLAERELRIDQMERRLTSSGRGTRHAYDTILGESEGMIRLLKVIDRVAQSEVPVIVFGESGSGKELVARAIHAHGPRAKKPFVAENCGAIPENLLESALFGHVRGAFTGADRPRVGLFDAADGGTLFLDEVGEMSLGMQTKLLRVIEDGMVLPVGSERARKVNVRIIVATHRDLEAMVKAKLFREDLFYRLNIISLQIPPLRERLGDVPLLLQHFLEKHSSGRPMKITRAAVERLSVFPWPGNIRQLENEVRRALVLADDHIDVEHLSAEVGGDRNSAIADAGLDLRRRVDLLEVSLVREAMDRSKGNQTKAAKLLGLSRFGLQKMMKRLEIG